jgi:hypothetical protein
VADRRKTTARVIAFSVEESEGAAERPEYGDPSGLMYPESPSYIATLQVSFLRQEEAALFVEAARRWIEEASRG